MNNVVEIEVSSHPKMMRLLRAVSEEIGALAGFNQEHLTQFQIAVDEAATNIIRHGYKFDASKHFKVTYTLLDDRLEVVLEDHGSPYQPGKSDSFDSAKPSYGGLGLLLIHRAMDEVEYSVTDSGLNRLRLIKYLHKKEEKDRGNIVAVSQ